jgi:hypothetical protein
LAAIGITVIIGAIIIIDAALDDRHTHPQMRPGMIFRLLAGVSSSAGNRS